MLIPLWFTVFIIFQEVIQDLVGFCFMFWFFFWFLHKLILNLGVFYFLSVLHEHSQVICEGTFLLLNNFLFFWWVIRDPSLLLRVFLVDLFFQVVVFFLKPIKPLIHSIKFVINLQSKILHHIENSIVLRLSAKCAPLIISHDLNIAS